VEISVHEIETDASGPCAGSSGRSVVRGQAINQARRSPDWLPEFVAITVLTLSAIIIAGYHSGIEDDAIYLAGIKKLLNPSLYPHDSQFFASQTNGFPLLRLIALSARVTHLPILWLEFALHFIFIFALISGCWFIARQCFQKFWERVGAVALVTVLLTMPVTGTSLYLADQHLHPRTPACAAILFAIGMALRRRYKLAMLFGAFAILLHPLMGAFGVAYVIVLSLPLERWKSVSHGMLAALPLPIILHPTAAWREAATTRSYFFLRNWEWYEWLGIFAPMLILWWFGRLAFKMGYASLSHLCKRLVLYSVIMSAAGLIVGLPAKLDWLAPIQPMRHLQIVYLLMMLSAGGLLAHYVLKTQIWRWMLLFIPLSAGMMYAQHYSFATSSHIEIPGVSGTNRWVKSFEWIQQNTPEDAYFAVDPNYMGRPGEDNFGFRAIAERSKLADYSKDAAVVAVSPDLAPRWKTEVEAMNGYRHFTRDNLLLLRARFGVDWALVEGATSGLDCPYRQNGLSVCHID